MQYTYSYTIPNLKFLEHLYNYIISSVDNTFPNDFHLNIEATLDVIFKQQLTVEQETILDNIILLYTPPQTLSVSFKTETIPLSQNTIMPTNTYTVIGTYFYTIPDDDSFISSFKIVSSVDGNTNYKIRVYDSINDTILCESNTLNNQTLQITTLSNVLNLPTNDTLLEVQCIVSGDNKCIVKLIQIEYSKLI